MAKSHSSKPIPPFPADIDRNAFGNYLSGFTDGEGCFMLAFHESSRLCRSGNTYTRLHFDARFTILLRLDDLAILETIQSYFGCGKIFHHLHRPASSPQANFEVRKPKDLFLSVIPHFDQYPLRAKKARDYVIWRRGVELAYRVWQKPSRARKGPGKSKGWHTRWTDEEKNEFFGLVAALKEQRKFSSPIVALPEPSKPAVQQTLFGNWTY